MKKYQVENNVADTEMINGEKPWDETVEDCVGDYVEAETGKEAIVLAITYLSEHLSDCEDVDVNYDKEEILITRNNGEKELYYNFTAKEVE